MAALLVIMDINNALNVRHGMEILKIWKKRYAIFANLNLLQYNVMKLILNYMKL